MEKLSIHTFMDKIAFHLEEERLSKFGIFKNLRMNNFNSIKPELTKAHEYMNDCQYALRKKRMIAQREKMLYNVASERFDISNVHLKQMLDNYFTQIFKEELEEVSKIEKSHEGLFSSVLTCTQTIESTSSNSFYEDVARKREDEKLDSKII
jgi:ketopantoate reductase